MKLGVVGFGARISGLVYGPFREVVPDLRIAGIVDFDEKNARKKLSESDNKEAVFYETLEEMVRKGKPDALVIGTRCDSHASYAIKAAQFDIPLFLEKPVAISIKQANDLETAFSKSDCPVVVSFPLRTSPLCTLAKNLIRNGAVGNPVHIMAWNYVPYGAVYWEEPYRNYKITGGLFLQKATHDFDYMSHLMDSTIVRVGAMATFQKVFGGKKPSGLVCSKCGEADTCLESPRNRKRNHSGWHENDHLCVYSRDCGTITTGTNEDASSAVVEFASGAHGIYTQVFFSRREAAARGSTVSGYLGTVEFDWYENSLRHIRHHKPFSDTTKADAGLSHFGGDLELAHNFFDVVKGKGQPQTSIWTGIQSVYTCLAARESALKNRFVKVRQAGQSG